jgi:hypothetical protein
MSSRKVLLGAGALMGWFAVGLQLVLMLENKTASLIETIIRFFSYYTILTNILVATCFASLWLFPNKWPARLFSKPGVTTSVSIYITVVGLVYQLALRSVWDPQGWQRLADELLHSIIPAYFFIYWAGFVRKSDIEWGHIPRWLIYPSSYLVFILIRGSFSGFYPYYFVDMTQLTVGQAILNISILILVFILFSGGFVALAKKLSKKATLAK